MLITNAEAVAWCHAGADEDLTIFVEIAEQFVVDTLNRKVYADQSALDAANDETGIVINGAVKGAILLLAGHYYANRESVVVGATVASLPDGHDRLLSLHRHGLGV